MGQSLRHAWPGCLSESLLLPQLWDAGGRRRSTCVDKRSLQLQSLGYSLLNTNGCVPSLGCSALGDADGSVTPLPSSPLADTVACCKAACVRGTCHPRFQGTCGTPAAGGGDRQAAQGASLGAMCRRQARGSGGCVGGRRQVGPVAACSAAVSAVASWRGRARLGQVGAGGWAALLGSCPGSGGSGGGSGGQGSGHLYIRAPACTPLPLQGEQRLFPSFLRIRNWRAPAPHAGRFRG